MRLNTNTICIICVSLTLFLLCTPDLLTENAAIDIVVNLNFAALSIHVFSCSLGAGGLLSSL